MRREKKGGGGGIEGDWRRGIVGRKEVKKKCERKGVVGEEEVARTLLTTFIKHLPRGGQ